MKKETKQRIQLVSIGLFLLYLMMLIYFLFFAEKMGRSFSGNFSERDYSYNLRLTREIKRFWTNRSELGLATVGLNILGNVLCFLPFGAILPILNRKARNFMVIVAASAEFSFIVECIQLITKVGSFDVDDILLNTLGGALGFVIFTIGNLLRRKHYG